MEMKDTPVQGHPWWGTVEFTEGSGKRWEIGPLTLWVRRLAQEWWIAFERDEKKQNRWSRLSIMSIPIGTDMPAWSVT